MTDTVDDRVVAMSFENEDFKSKVDETVSGLSRLKSALNLSGAAKGFNEIDSAARGIDLSHIESSVDGISRHFSLMGIAGVASLATIAVKAVDVGREVAASLTIEPIMEGFHNYETQINAVQTIVANTGLKGAQGLAQINGVLADLNRYANLTIYNFSDMTRAIGTFTAAGVGLKDSTEAIKGIANLAALSGATAQQASGAMYQLSQALAQGSVKLQDWNSVIAAGIGGKVFQSALFTTAEALGTLKNVHVGETFDEWTKAGNSFYNSLHSGQRQVSAATDAAQKYATAQKDAARTVADAQQAANDSIRSAAESVQNAQQGVVDAARQGARDIASAQQAIGDAAKQGARDVANAQQAVTDATKQGIKDVATAVQQEQDTIAQSAQTVQTALDGVRQARQRLTDAMKPPSADELQAAQDQVTTAQLDQADTSRAVALAQEQQTRAAQDLVIAQQQLAAVQDSIKSTPDQILQAQRAVQDAQQRVTDLADAQTRALLQQHAATRTLDQANQNLQDTNEKGTKKDKNVVTAQDALTQALKQYSDAQIKAQKDVAAAEQNVIDTRLKAQKNLQQAEQNYSDVRIRSQQNLIHAEQNYADVRIRTAESEKRAGQQLADAEISQARTIQQAQKSVADAHARAAVEVKKAYDAMNPKASTSGRGIPSWITSKVLSETLKQFAGDMTTAQLKAQGFTDQQIAHIEQMGKTATAAATNVRTLTQLTTSLREEVGTAWAAIFKTLFGNINQATATFSSVHNVLEAALTNPLKAFNNLLIEWSQLGGRTKLLDALKSGFEALSAVINVVKKAWEDLFPAPTANRLYDLTVKFDNFMKSLMPTPKTLSELKRVFEGLFAIFDIGRTVVEKVFHVLSSLFDIVGGPAGGGFLSLAAHVGDLLVHFDHLIRSGAVLHTFFGALAADIKDPARLFDEIKKAIDRLFGGVSSGGISHALDDLKNKLFPLNGQTSFLTKAWDGFTHTMQEAEKAVRPLIKGMSNLFQSVLNFLTNSFQNLNFDNVLHAIDTGLLGGIFLLFKRFFDSAKIPKLAGAGVLKSMKEIFEGLTGSLKALQQDIKSDAIMHIAIAVGILAASMVAVSLIDPKRLTGAMGGLTVAFGELLGAVKLLNVSTMTMGVAKLPVIAIGLEMLAGAIVILSAAMKVLSTMDWEHLTRGLAGVGGLLLIISRTVGPISANSAGMISAGLGITAIAVGIRVLVDAVGEFGGMHWETLVKGLSAVGAILVGIGLSAKVFPTGMIGIGLGISAIAVGMRILVKAIRELGDIDVGHLVKGIASMGAALAVIGIAMAAMPPGLLLQAAGMVAIAVSLKIIASALDTFGIEKGNNIGKGLLSMGGALAILAVALNAMTGALPGAAALVIATTAIVALVPALALLGHQKIGDIVKALVALAGAITVMGVTGAAIATFTPALLGLGAALLLIGGALALAGGGIALFGVGLGAIAAAGPIAIAAIVHSITEFVTAIPKMLGGALTALIQVAGAFAKAAPQFVTAIAHILNSIMDTVIIVMPKIITLFGVLVRGAIKAIRDNFPQMVTTGLDMLVSLLSGIQSHIHSVATHAFAIVTKFLDALADKMPDIVKSGTHLLVKFLDGIATNIHKVVDSVVNLLVHFVNAVADNVWRISKAGLNVLGKFLAAILSGEKLILNTAVKLLTNFLDGVTQSIPKVRKSALHMMKVFIDNLVQAALTLTNTAADAIVTFLNGIADAINKHSQDIWNAGWNIAWSIIMGMVHGLENLAHKVVKKVEDIITFLPKQALDLLESFSPSRVFMRIGGHIVDGLYLGIANNEHKPAQAVEHMTKKMITTINGMASSLHGAMDIKDPVITPVLDLSKVKTASKLLPGYISPKAAIDINANIVRASGRVPNPTSLSAVDSAQVGDSAPSSVTFVQNNNSPKSLSEIEIYRQTNNQISQLKRLPALAGR